MPIRNIVTGHYEDSGMHEFAKEGLNKTGVSIRPKRTRVQHEADMALISKLLLRENMSPNEITTKIAQERPYTLAESTIRMDIKELLRRWREAYIDDIDTLKGRELRRVDELEAAYWDSYDRSLRASSINHSEVTEYTKENEADSLEMIGVADIEAPPTTAATTSKRKKTTSFRKYQDERDGDYRFLSGIQWCIEKRCEILGLNAPVKAEMTFDWRTEAQKQGIDPGLAFNEIVKKFIDGNIVDSPEVKELHE